ncbi:MAG: PepSY domain-containing protein [Pseudomonadota bacterium]|nr:PepSY domain-containing protein [Pseudomonadota bacterium]
MLKPILAVTALAAIPAGIALADGKDYRGSLKDAQPMSAVLQLAEENGWMVRELDMDDGFYEVEARNAEGRMIEVKLHPETLQIVEHEYDDDDDDDWHGNANNPARAGTAEPPQNGLFAPGAAPQVEVK